jgi:hypothetical protein
VSEAFRSASLTFYPELQEIIMPKPGEFLRLRVLYQAPPELHQITGQHEIVIVIFNGLQLTYMADTADGRAAYAVFQIHQTSQEVLLSVPFVTQYLRQPQQNFDCGPASDGMVLAYYHKDPGLNTNGLIAILQATGELVRDTDIPGNQRALEYYGANTTIVQNVFIVRLMFSSLFMPLGQLCHASMFACSTSLHNFRDGIHFSLAPFYVYRENARNTCWNPRLVFAPTGHCWLTCSVASNQENTR